MSELINILIRHKKDRAKMFNRCLQSVWSQTYKDWRIWISLEGSDWRFPVLIHPRVNFISVPKQHYNLHCNALKEKVDNGWFLYLDDDDALASPTVLDELVFKIKEPAAYIGQFLRNGRKKPSNTMIERGEIKYGLVGGGCVVLHHSFKDHADWQGIKGGDFQWIKDLKEADVPFKFIPLVLQKTFQKGNGL